MVCDALLLKAIDFGESDRIVHLLTPVEGRLTAIAKGARRSVKRFPGTLDLFNHLRIHIERRRGSLAPAAQAPMARLEQATLVEPFLSLRVIPSRFALACYLVELLDRLAPEGGDPRDAKSLFEFALDALGAVARCVPDARLRVLLELRTLATLGFRPQLRCCVRCGREVSGPGQVAFNVPEGGVVCGACAARLDGLLPVHLGTLRALERALEFDPRRLDRLSLGAAALEEARHLVGRFARYHLGLELRSERFLDETLAVSDRTSPRGSA